MSFCTCIEPWQGRDLPSCPLCPMVPWKDMSDPGKAWQDKKVFPDEYCTNNDDQGKYWLLSTHLARSVFPDESRHPEQL